MLMLMKSQLGQRHGKVLAFRALFFSISIKKATVSNSLLKNSILFETVAPVWFN
jgi:hypothetical protein